MTFAKLPLRPGYSSVGRVEAVGARVDEAAESAAWFALAQIAFRGLWTTDTRIGGSLVVVGAGPIRQMVVRWASAAGLGIITVVDPAGQRLRHALDGGAHHVFDSTIADIVEALHGENEAIPTTYIHTTGNPHVFSDVQRRVPRFGRVVLLGDAGHPGEQRLTSDVLIKDPTIVGAFGAQNREGWPNERVRALFLDLLSAGRFSVDGMVSHRFPPKECREAYDLLVNSRESIMGVSFVWEYSRQVAAPDVPG